MTTGPSPRFPFPVPSGWFAVAWSDDLARDRHCAQEVAENAHDPAADEGDERPMFG